MSSKLRKNYIRVTFAVGLLLASACSTTEVSPPKPPVPPVYTQVMHPIGMDLGDLSAIFLDEGAPKDPNLAKTCDADFKKLKSLTDSADEVSQGIRELVKQDPVSYHWCFYRKLYELENFLKSDAYVDEKQKESLAAYDFLVPVARSFSLDFHDSRYLRWAVTRYQRLSEWIFYRKMELTPSGTVELVQPANPFGLYRNSSGTQTVLEKYHLVKVPEEVKLVDAPPTMPLTPVPEPSAVPVAIPVDPIPSPPPPAK